MTIGLLHPGSMGSVVGTALRNGGYDVVWAGEGRSLRSRERAEQARLRDVGTVAAMAAASEAIFSVCPPEFADAVAGEVIAAGFRGTFIDANAISPARTLAMGERLSRAGIAFVDGGIIGPAVVKPLTTWIYLSGPRAADAARLFHAGPIVAETVGSEIGQASALKMCFAAYNKGRAALLTATLAASERFGVREVMYQQWERRNDGPARADAEAWVTAMTPRAWRFAAEMREIASTFASAGLPGEFHEGAAQLYEMLREFKDAENLAFPEVLAALAPPRPAVL